MSAPRIQLPSGGITDGIVRLRELRESDIPAILTACEDPAIRRYNSAPHDEAEARAWLAGEIKNPRSSRAFRLAVAEAESDHLIGSLGVREPHPNAGRIEVGYWLAPSVRGRGLAARALRLFCSWAFRELSLARIEAIPELENRDSHRLLERSGFTREGLLRAYQTVQGERRDMVMYSLLPGEER